MQSLAAQILSLLAQMGPLDDSGEFPPPSIQVGDYGAAFAKMFLTLFALLALLFATYWLIRKMIHQRLQKGASDQAIQILEKKMLSPKTMLYLISVDNKRVLIAESQLEVRRLETGHTEVDPAPLSQESSFKNSTMREEVR